MRTHIRYLFITAIILLFSVVLLQGSSAKHKSINPKAIDSPSSDHAPALVRRFQIVNFAMLDSGVADLGVTKLANSDTVNAGSDSTYTIEVSNNGPDNSDSATLNDPLPVGTTFVSLSVPAGWTCSTPKIGDNGTITCTNPSLPAGSDDTFTLVVHVPQETAPGTFFTNTATVSAATPGSDPNDENNSSSAGTMVAAKSTDVGVSKSAGSPTVRADSDVGYTIEVRNNGPDVADSVSFNDTLPGDMTFVSLVQTSGPSFSCSTPAAGSGGTVTCTNLGLPANSSAVFNLVTHVPPGTNAGASYTNTATVTTTTQDSNDENNSSLVTITVADCITNPLVTSNADSGPGSLRQAIQDACVGDTITFADNLVGPITLTSGELLIDKTLTINGPGANILAVQRSTVSGTPNFRIFDVNNGIAATISGLTISNGQSGAGQGGGISNQGTLTVLSSTLNGNSAASGGGIYNSGTLTVLNSTLSGNTADGGGIYNNGSGSVNIFNSTLSGNSAGFGGGVNNNSTGTVTVINSTLTNNRADINNIGSGTGGGIYRANGTVILRNTIVAGNFRGASADDINGLVDASSSNNLIGTGGAGGLTNGAPNNNQVDVADARLGPLANNGGPTPTHALLINSPALDAGSNTLLPQDTFDLDNDGDTTEPLPVDQRGQGFQRIADSADADTTQTVDIGAYEAQVSVEDIADKTTNEDTPISFDFNVGDAALITSVTATSSNTTLVPNNTANLSVTGTGSTRTLRISPAANLSGTTTITVTVNGSNSQTMSDTFVLTVNAVNDAPVADSQSVTTNEDTPKAITLTGSDVDSSSLSYIIVANPAHGTLSGSAPNLTYTPSANYNGTDSFTFKINDGSADSNIATVSITINAVNDAPQALNDSYSTNENTTLNMPAAGVLTNDTDVDSPSLTAILVSNASNGTAVVNANGSFTYTPNAGFSGTDSFTYKANDGAADSNQATVTISVKEGGALQFSSATYSVNESGGSATITITRTGGSAGTATVLFSTSNGTALAGQDYTTVSQTVTFNNG
ncbi:MAG: hypothetical protein QOH63_4253, partial [Acidobacteriota bacterium]|nr:hypothetical protein [Acidobacteriota bacterium]